MTQIASFPFAPFGFHLTSQPKITNHKLSIIYSTVLYDCLVSFHSKKHSCHNYTLVKTNFGKMVRIFRCKTKTGKDHRSFRSDKATWDHLKDCHDYEIDKINLEQ